MAKIRFAPSILSADFTRLGAQVQEVEAAGADMIHIDVMDGRFVPNLTMGALIVEAVRRVTTLPLDVHLMIVEPDHLLSDFASAGADRISVHLEACPNLHRTLQRIRELSCKAGVALNPHSPASLIAEILHMVDEVVVMTVNPGFGGQTFLDQTLPKIAQLRALIADQSIDLIVDGGINADTLPRAVAAGADVMVVGSAVFHAVSIEAGFTALRQSLGAGEA